MLGGWDTVHSFIILEGLVFYLLHIRDKTRLKQNTAGENIC